MSRKPIGMRWWIAHTRIGLESRRGSIRAMSHEGAVAPRRRLHRVRTRLVALACLRLACVRDHLLELRHRQHARHTEFADDEGRRTTEAEGIRLIVVALQDCVDVL